MEIFVRFQLVLVALVFAGCSGGLVEHRVASDGQVERRRVLGRDATAVPQNSGHRSVQIGSTAVAYHLPRPTGFIVPPVAAPVLRRGEMREVFAAYYEVKPWPGEVPRYEVAATVTRLQKPAPAADPGSASAVLNAIRDEKNFRLLTRRPVGEQSIRSEVVGGNRWTVFRGFDTEDRAALDRVIFVRLVEHGEYVLLFRLNFWSAAKGPEWRAGRVRLLEDIVRTVTFSTAQRSNQAMQLTASKPDVYAGSVCRRDRMLRGMHRGLAAADLVAR